jgi:hypothetical protein
MQMYNGIKIMRPIIEGDTPYTKEMLEAVDTAAQSLRDRGFTPNRALGDRIAVTVYALESDGRDCGEPYSAWVSMKDTKTVRGGK